MNVEEYCLERIPVFLNYLDPEKKSTAIDIGVGTFNFYCVVFRKAGYKTIAVEPLPNKTLKKLAKEHKIILVEACIYTKAGKVDIYSGVYKDNDLPDVSSINKNWWGVTNKSNKRKVKSLTLFLLFKKYKIDNVSYMKIDTEGTEWEIISQLNELEESKHPKVIEFEYGGGSNRGSSEKGWSEEYFGKTLKTIRFLQSAGYSSLILIERENTKPIEYKTIPDIIESIFEDHFVYGDILMCKKDINLPVFE